MSSTVPHLPKFNFGAHFLTAATFKRTPLLAVPTCASIFCKELEAARQKYGFDVFAFVVMPDHIHLVLWWDTLALPDLTISKIAWAVKGLSARRMVDYLKQQQSIEASRIPRQQTHFHNWQYKIWQQGAGYDFNIYSRQKLIEKITYLHANPIRAGLAALPEDYPWSSAADYAGVDSTHGVHITNPL